MKSRSDILRRVGEALCGERWQFLVSRDLGVTDRTVRNWAAVPSAQQARDIVAGWVDDFNTERLHSSLGYANPAAFAAELEKQWAGCSQPIASPALARNDNRRSLIPAG